MYEVFERLLKEKGVRASDVCKATGVSSSAITDWKKGRYSPKADKLQKIADYFEVPIDYLMTGEMPSGYYINSETARVAQEIFENNELRALFSVERDMKPEDLKALHTMALALKRKEGYDGDDPA